jgi:hypothetical protein
MLNSSDFSTAEFRFFSAKMNQQKMMKNRGTEAQERRRSEGHRAVPQFCSLFLGTFCFIPNLINFEKKFHSQKDHFWDTKTSLLLKQLIL